MTEISLAYELRQFGCLNLIKKKTQDSAGYFLCFIGPSLQDTHFLKALFMPAYLYS